MLTSRVSWWLIANDPSSRLTSAAVELSRIPTKLHAHKCRKALRNFFKLNKKILTYYYFYANFNDAKMKANFRYDKNKNYSYIAPFIGVLVIKNE